MLSCSRKIRSVLRVLLLIGPVLGLGISIPDAAWAQSPAANQNSVTADTDEPLTEDELEVLVARIALYPDDLVALVTSASIYPLQIIEADRYLDRAKKDKSLKPKSTWDGSIVSLLNYPQILTMMSDDLEWTQQLGDALTDQQEDVLAAIQQLRDEAVTNGIIKSDDKIKVVEENNNVVIQPTNSEKIYVPQYEPEMLYASDYAPAPISYYPEPYSNYYYPNAPYFAAAVTGAVWAAAVDWDNWGVWGGGWDNDIDIDCNNCLNNINGKMKLNDVDWRNVDRSKIGFDDRQFNNMSRNDFKQSLKANNNNRFDKRVNNARNSGNTNVANRSQRANNKVSVDDVRAAKNSKKRTAANDNRQVNKDRADNRKNASNNKAKARNTKKDSANRSNKRGDIKKSSKANRQVKKSKPGARPDNRRRQPSAMGEIRGGKTAQRQSNRGRASMSHRSRGGMRPQRHGGRRR